MEVLRGRYIDKILKFQKKTTLRILIVSFLWVKEVVDLDVELKFKITICASVFLCHIYANSAAVFF